MIFRNFVAIAAKLLGTLKKKQTSLEDFD